MAELKGANAKELDEDIVVTSTAELKPKDEYKSVKESDLVELISSVKALQEQNKALLSIADKNKLSKYFEAQQGDVEREVKLSVMNGKVVMKWSDMTIDDVGKNQAGVPFAIQEFDYITEDGEKHHTSLRDFVRLEKKITGVVKKQYQNEDLENILEVDVNGKIYKMNLRFVNR